MSDDENKTERVQLLMRPSELKAIDDWMFANRIRTRAEAIRRLCQMGIGLDTEAKELRRQAEDIGKQSKKVFLEYIASYRSQKADDAMQFAERFVDLLGAVFGHFGFVDRLVSASNLSKTPVDEDLIPTYKESLEAILEKHRDDLRSSRAGKA